MMVICVRSELDITIMCQVWMDAIKQEEFKIQNSIFS